MAPPARAPASSPLNFTATTTALATTVTAPAPVSAPGPRAFDFTTRPFDLNVPEPVPASMAFHFTATATVPAAWPSYVTATATVPAAWPSYVTAAAPDLTTSAVTAPDLTSSSAVTAPVPSLFYFTAPAQTTPTVPPVARALARPRPRPRPRPRATATVTAPAPSPAPVPAPGTRPFNFNTTARATITAPAPVPAPAPTRQYFTAVVTQLLNTFNPTLKRWQEYLVFMVANLTFRDLDPPLPGVQASEAVVFVQYGLTTELPPHPSGLFFLRLYIQPGGLRRSMPVLRQRELFTPEEFQAFNNCGLPIVVHSFRM